jgi:hypothetical protein
MLQGVEITDSDHDGLADAWENSSFGNLNEISKGDPDGDGYNNSREQLMGTDPDADNRPILLQQPTSQNVASGSPLTLEVQASAAFPLRYQWRKNGSNISGATNSSYSFSPVQLLSQGTYTVEVGNIDGWLTTTGAVLTPYLCHFSLSTNAFSFGSAGGDGNLTLTTSNDCLWSVSNTNSWLTILSSNSLSGSASVEFTVPANPGYATRTATFLVAGQIVTVTQSGNMAPPSVEGRTFTFFIASGSGAFATNGTYLLLLSTTNGQFSVIPLSGSTVSQSGSFAFTQGAMSNGTLAVDFGTFLLNYTSRVAGAFLLTNSSGDLQTGSFSSLITGADFDGNGRADLVFQRTNFTLMAWKLNGTAFLGSALLKNGATAGSGWRVVATEDFNHDGMFDLLFQHTTGKLKTWFMNGTAYSAAANLRGGATKKIVGMGDFNGDGKRDILFESPGRVLSTWLMDGTAFLGTGTIAGGQAATTGWHAFAAADFNADGQDDVLFQHDTGKLSAWVMNKNVRLRIDALNSSKSPGGTWRAHAVADLNGDGRYDIVFQNSSRSILVWLMNGKSLAGKVSLNGGRPLPSGWQLVAPR